jgi:urea transport system ATP-binding protein
VFGYFPILKDFLHRRGGDLSGGQQQQLAIARALIMRPKILLLDEPTEGIQPNIIQEIGDVLSDLKAQGGMAIVLVEQYFEFAWRLADRVYVLKRGAVSLEGEVGNLDKATLQDAVSV